MFPDNNRIVVSGNSKYLEIKQHTSKLSMGQRRNQKGDYEYFELNRNKNITY